MEKEILAHHAAGTLPQLFVKLIREHRRDEEGETFRATLVALHNDGAINVLALVDAIVAAQTAQNDFFLIQGVYVDIIPKLKATVPAMMAAVKTLVSRGGDDLASGQPNVAFQTWAESADRARTILSLIDPSSPEDATYVFLALRALAKTEPEAALEKAITLLAGTDTPARVGAAKAIGTVPLRTVEARLESLAALESASKFCTDDNLLGHILTAAVDIARSAPVEVPTVVKLIDTVAVDAGDRSIDHAISTLMFHADDLPLEIVDALTRIAHKICTQNKGTLDRLDHATARLLDHGRVDEALALIAPILSAHEELRSLEQLDGFAHALLRLEREHVTRIIVKWLLSLDRNLGEAARSLVGRHHGDSLLLEFDAAPLALSDAEIILLAHRTIGYLFLHPITAASIVLSLLRVASAEGRQKIEDILFEPLLINFSGDLSQWLKARAVDAADPVLPAIERLLARLDAYLDGLRQAGRIKELQPSERERLIEIYRQQEKARRMHKEIEKRSILMSLVSRSVLLYGNRSISYFQDPNGKWQRHEMKLHSFSHSFEAPRLDIIEPFELDYTLRAFRAMRIAP
jgi:hypothetical protein